MIDFEKNKKQYLINLFTNTNRSFILEDWDLPFTYNASIITLSKHIKLIEYYHIENWKIYSFFINDVYIWRFEIMFNPIGIKKYILWNTYISNDNYRWKWIFKKVVDLYIKKVAPIYKIKKLYMTKAMTISAFLFCFKNQEFNWEKSIKSFFITEKFKQFLNFIKNTKDISIYQKPFSVFLNLPETKNNLAWYFKIL